MLLSRLIDNRIERRPRYRLMEEILEIVKGPDFPTGATILGKAGIEEAYRTGRGKIRVRAVSDIETAAKWQEPHCGNRASVSGK